MCFRSPKIIWRSRDGRSAYAALYHTHLGPNNVNNIANAAETRLQNLSYTGEKRRWNFAKYSDAHKEEHNILNGLKQHGYSGIDPSSMVRHLNAGIKTSELDVPKGQIMASAQLCQDFEGAVRTYKDYITQKGLDNKDVRNISAVHRESTKSKPSKIEDRYYSAKEYKTLTPDQRMELKRLRDARGHKPNKKAKFATSKEVKEMKATIAALKAKLKPGSDPTSSDDSDDSEPKSKSKTDTNSTRANCTLTRPDRKASAP